MIEHIVLIRWKEGISREQVSDVLDRARMLEGIEGVESVSTRRTYGTNKRDHGITDLMTLRLADAAALERFGLHDLHKEFGVHMTPLIEDVTIVDVMA